MTTALLCQSCGGIVGISSKDEDDGVEVEVVKCWWCERREALKSANENAPARVRDARGRTTRR